MYKVKGDLKNKNLREKGEIIMEKTKREWLNEIKAELTDEGQIGFINEQLAQLDNKAEKARIRAAAKREAGDELRERIFNVLTDEPKTIPAIVAELNDEEISEAKARARLSQLVQLERVAKEKVKTDSGEKMGYFVPSVDEQAE